MTIKSKIVKMEETLYEMREEPISEKWKFADYNTPSTKRLWTLIWEQEKKLEGYKEALKDVRELIEKKYKKKGYNRFYYELLEEILEELK